MPDLFVVINQWNLILRQFHLITNRVARMFMEHNKTAGNCWPPNRYNLSQLTNKRQLVLLVEWPMRFLSEVHSGKWTQMVAFLVCFVEDVMGEHWTLPNNQYRDIADCSTVQKQSPKPVQAVVTFCAAAGGQQLTLIIKAKLEIFHTEGSLRLIFPGCHKHNKPVGLGIFWDVKPSLLEMAPCSVQ